MLLEIPSVIIHGAQAPESGEIRHSSHNTEGQDPRVHQAFQSNHSSQPNQQRGPVRANSPSPNSPFLIKAEPIRPESNCLSCGSRRRVKRGHLGLEASPPDQLIKGSIPSTLYSGWAPGSQALPRQGMHNARPVGTAQRRPPNGKDKSGGGGNVHSGRGKEIN